MKLRVAVIVVVILMVLVSFSGMSRNVSADDLPAVAPTASGSVNGTANLTAPTASTAAVSTPAALTSPFPAGVISGQNTYV